ncbi:MAG: hypothetical protein JNL60_19635 [Bacteroidia bacterium]|nr:hypothetical protein [Bacteroidia bacterium]
MSTPKIVFLLLLMAGFLSCKKNKQEEPAPTPEPVKTGTLNIKVELYDSLGQRETDASDIKVSLAPLTQNMVTNSEGLATFTELKYGDYFPTLQKYWYEGVPAKYSLNASSSTAVMPFAKYSQYRLMNMGGQVVNKDSVVISYHLTKPVPADKPCKLAVITNTSSVSPFDFMSVDIVTNNLQDVNKQNIAKLPGVKNFLSSIKDSAVFYVDVIPVSYGTYYSNLTLKTILLGRNPSTNNNLPLRKNW